MADIMENKAVMRLTALMAAGYVPNSPAQPSDAVSLEHPDRKFKYRHAYLYEDGRVVAPFSGKDEVRIYTDSTDSEFHNFVRSVPKPDGWQAASHGQFWSGLAAGIGASIVGYMLFLH